MQKSIQVGREYTNIRYSTEGGLTPTSSPQPQTLESPTGKLSKSTLSLASISSHLLTSNHATLPKLEKLAKEKNPQSRAISEHPAPL